MPSLLYVLSPHGQQRCAGEYALVADQAPNGQLLWKQVGGSFWLYSGVNDMWIIGGLEAREKDFRCQHGVLFCKVLHGGLTPDKVAGTWQRLDGDAFVEDPDIVITTHSARPFALRVVSPNGQQKVAGEYLLVPREAANGQPLWRQAGGGKCWLYSGKEGHWIIGGTDAREKSFKCSRGVIHSKRAHGGVMPERIGCVWLRLDGDAFVEDAAIAISIKPAPLYVQSPNGQQRCAGEYVPVPDKLASGQPMWQHIGGQCWLYSGTNGMWIIGGADAKLKLFQCTRGVIYCKVAHGGETPDKMVSGWARLEGEHFREDAAISVSTKPETLYVVTPHGQQRCAGEYRLRPGETVNGHSVWKQRRGACRIYSSPGGTWNLGSDEANENDFQNAPSSIHSQRPHEGRMPDKVTGLWLRADGDTYVEDTDLAVTTVVHKPAKLHVKSPNGQQRCAGEYALYAGMMANGQPLWKQLGGKYWLYSGNNGMWIFGSSGARTKNFECSRGVIYSNTMHGGLMPDKLQSLWLRLDGEAFHEDAAITVGADHGARKRGKPE